MKRMAIWIVMASLCLVITSCSETPIEAPSQASTSNDNSEEPYRAPKTDTWLEQAAENDAPIPAPNDGAQEIGRAEANLQMTEPRPMAFAPRQNTDLAPRISVEELRQLMASNELVLVDVRDVQAYGFEHAEGAINIPELQLYDQVDKLPKNKRIVTYCT